MRNFLYISEEELEADAERLKEERQRRPPTPPSHNVKRWVVVSSPHETSYQGFKQPPIHVGGQLLEGLASSSEMGTNSLFASGGSHVVSIEEKLTEIDAFLGGSASSSPGSSRTTSGLSGDVRRTRLRNVSSPESIVEHYEGETEAPRMEGGQPLHTTLSGLDKIAGGTSKGKRRSSSAYSTDSAANAEYRDLMTQLYRDTATQEEAILLSGGVVTPPVHSPAYSPIKDSTLLPEPLRPFRPNRPSIRDIDYSYPEPVLVLKGSIGDSQRMQASPVPLPPGRYDYAVTSGSKKDTRRPDADPGKSVSRHQQGRESLSTSPLAGEFEGVKTPGPNTLQETNRRNIPSSPAAVSEAWETRRVASPFETVISPGQGRVGCPREIPGGPLRHQSLEGYPHSPGGWV